MALYVTTWTVEHLQILEAAIATGTKEVYYGNKKVQYQSMRDMLMARDIMIKALYPVESVDGAPGGRRVATFDRAL